MESKMNSPLYKVDGSKLITLIVYKVDKHGKPSMVRNGLTALSYDMFTMFEDPEEALKKSLYNITNDINDLQVKQSRLNVILKEISDVRLKYENSSLK